MAEELHGDKQTTQHFRVDIVQADGLQNEGPPLALVEEVEDQYSDNAGAVVIHKEEAAQQPAQQQQRAGGEHNQSGLVLELIADLVEAPHHQQGDDEGEEDVLVGGVEKAGAAGHHQVEGDLREKGEEDHAAQIALKILGAEVAFSGEEGEDGEGNTAHPRQPAMVGGDGGPGVVHQHDDHAQKVQAGGGDIKAGTGFFHGKGPFL